MQELFDFVLKDKEGGIQQIDVEMEQWKKMKSDNRKIICTKNAIEIVKELAEECNHGWIDASIEVPSTNRYILLSFSNFSIPQIGRYEADEEGGAFYIGDDTETCVSQDLFVNAWMELPEPYKERDTDAEL